MKKIILAIALFAAVSANAQSDGFFTSNYSYGENRQDPNNEEWGTLPAIFGHDYEYDQNAESVPVGSGLLVLAGLGVAYAIRRKN